MKNKWKRILGLNTIVGWVEKVGQKTRKWRILVVTHHSFP